MRVAYRRFLAVVVISVVTLASGCSEGQKDNSFTQEGSQAIASSSLTVAPHGIDTNSPIVSDRATLNCFVDADRGNDFIVHGNFHLPGTTPEGQDITTGRFQIVSPATETIREELRATLGQTVSLFGKLDSAYGSDQGLFFPVSLKPSPQTISPAPSWTGWGRIDSTSGGRFFECTDSAALTDWVSALSGLADELGLPAGGKVSEILAQAEKDDKISAMKYKTQQVLPFCSLVYSGDKALADLRSGAGQFAFVTSSNALHNLLVRSADIRESDVEQFMAAAKSVIGEGEGPHKQALATIFGYAKKNKNGVVFVEGVEGDSFSQWMSIFRGQSSGYPIKWEALGVPEQCLEGNQPVYYWFAGRRVLDRETNKWHFSVNEVISEKRYKATLAVLPALEQ